MANDLLGVSVTGLRLAQAALSTVGHNIANADTEGYSRQRVEAVTNPANLLSGSYVGNGVKIEDINRVVNGFVSEQLRTDQTLFQDLDSFYNQVRQLDNLLSDDATGLSGVLNQFSAAVQNGANDPTSIPARQLIISEAENLAGRFTSIYDRLQTIEAGISDGMEVAVEQINALSGNIAQLNVKISNALGVSGGASPNDLFDQRDRALQELSGLIPIQVFDQGNGQVNVAVGTGQSLVIGKDARELDLHPSESDPAELGVYFKSVGQLENITATVGGGELGGMIRFRDQVLDSVYNELGRIGVVMADQFNRVNRSGLDLDGQFGQGFFYDINGESVTHDRVIANSANSAPDDQVLSLAVRDSGKLTTSDYSVDIDGGGIYRITRASDGAQVASGLLPGRLPFSVEFDGLELEFEQGAFAAGDSFLLQPVASGARDFASVLTSPEDIAFASPLLTDASLGNQGSGQISAGEVTTLFAPDGEALPLFAIEGSMAPPLVVSFTSPTTYDILDNSDPGNPVQLEPPIRAQRYVPGANNLLFATDPGGTLVSSAGAMIGLPDGRQAVTQAALMAATSPPDFAVTDFSASANQFAFDLVVSESLTAGNASYTITVNGAALADEQALLTHINAQLSGSGAQAYLDDNGGLAFRLTEAGYGNISLGAFDADPDGNGDAVAAGLANGLLGFDIENFTFTTDGDADGIGGVGTLTNGYPSELITITRAPSSPGLSPVTTRIDSALNGSAKQLASELSNIAGVEANAFNYVEISDLTLSQSVPLQIQVNGENLLPPASTAGLGADVPDPISQQEDFYAYLAERINGNEKLAGQGIFALAGVDPITGANELRIHNSDGDDIAIALTAAAGDSIAVGDGEHGPVNLVGAGNSLVSSVVVGGRLDVSLGDGLSLSTLPPDSMLFGDTTAEDFARETYLGIQATLTGNPQTGDVFTLSFNADAGLDNRNALKFVGLFESRAVNGVTNFSQSYGNLVEMVGIETNAAKTNRDAAEQVLRQTQAMRDSISGVNLDEEAADLIRFEQLFSANAQVISVARDIFDRLISSF